MLICLQINEQTISRSGTFREGGPHRRLTIARNIISNAPLAFDGLDTDCNALKQHLQTAEQLRTSLVQLGEFAGDVQKVATSIASGLRGQVNQPQVAAATEYLAKYRALQDAISEFETVAGHPLPDRDTDDFLGKLSQQMDDLEQSRNLFRDWSSWCAIRARAIAKGLAPLRANRNTEDLAALEAVTLADW